MWTNPPEQVHDFERQRAFENAEGPDAAVIRRRLNRPTVVAAVIVCIILLAIAALAIFS